MGKQYPQTAEAKQSLSNSTFKYIVAIREYENKNRIFTKDELVANTNLSERAVRVQLSEIANHYPIFATSDRKGYQILSYDENTTDEELKEMVEKTEHQLAELQSRIDALKARMRPLIAFRESANKTLIDREFAVIFD